MLLSQIVPVKFLRSRWHSVVDDVYEFFARFGVIKTLRILWRIF
jgi:hypothetical protein